MNKWLVLFLVGIYVYVPLTSLHPELGWIAIILSLVSGCFNVANAVKMQRNPNTITKISMKTIMIFKLCLLPAYIAFLMILVVSLGMILSIWFTIVGVFMLPLVVIYSYFVLFTSSSMVISRIIILGRKGDISIWKCIIHIIMQLLFVTDVIGSIIVYRKERDAVKKARINE